MRSYLNFWNVSVFLFIFLSSCASLFINTNYILFHQTLFHLLSLKNYAQLDPVGAWNTGTFIRGETSNFHNGNNNNYVIIFIATFVDANGSIKHYNCNEYLNWPAMWFDTYLQNSIFDADVNEMAKWFQQFYRKYRAAKNNLLELDVWRKSIWGKNE